MRTSHFENFIYKAGISLGISALLAGAALSGIAASAQSATLSQQLDYGEKNSDVTTLQQFLSGYPNFYPSGLVTGYFGSLTRAAVTSFQANHGLASVGRVGPQTLALINSIILGGNVVSVAGAPVVASPVQLLPSNTSALFSWNVNEPSRVKIFYSNTPITTVETSADFTEPYISGSVVQDTNLSTSHSLTIPNLSPNTTYYYMTESIDASGNVTVWPYPAGTFVTTS